MFLLHIVINNKVIMLRNQIFFALTLFNAFISIFCLVTIKNFSINVEEYRHIHRANQERDRVYIIERGAEDDAGELGLVDHQEINYVRCFLRPNNFVTCQVHTPAVDVQAQCRSRRQNEFLVDSHRCRWENPSLMAHP